MNTIGVWFSCGAASAVVVKKTIEKYGKYHKILIINNPIKEEHPDNRRFLKDVEKWINTDYFWYKWLRIKKYKIIEKRAKKYPKASIFDVFEKRQYISGTKGAPCTVELKKQARYEFEIEHDITFHVLGFTYDEKQRHERFVKFERSNVIPVLIDAGITKQDCFEILKKAGIKLPVIYSFGFPNANCIGCVKATSPTYWNLVRKFFPDAFNKIAKFSRKLGVKLVRVKGKRIFLDELKETDKGNKIKSWECGIFCDTK